jgi:hypothetical protein
MAGTDGRPTIDEALAEFLFEQEERLAARTFRNYADVIHLLDRPPRSSGGGHRRSAATTSAGGSTVSGRAGVPSADGSGGRTGTEGAMPFVGVADVVVKQRDDKNWRTQLELSYEGKKQNWTVPRETDTDFASVPRVFVWFLPRYGRYTKAAILHDYLWRTEAADGQISWIDADAVFRRAMRELQVPFLRRWMMWAAVRWAALTKPRGMERWWRESWRVLLVTLVAAPFVIPPAVIIFASLAVFWVFEAIVWVPLKLASLVRSKVAPRAVKEVNAPTFDLTMS